MEQAWVTSIRDRCRAADVPFFFKQWGGTRKARAGRVLDGTTYDQVPPRPSTPLPSAEQRRASLLAAEALAVTLVPLAGMRAAGEPMPAS
jgi:hypothetical protein